MATIPKKVKMYEQIKAHGEKLNAIYHTELDPVDLCKKLLRVERKAHKNAETSCNEWVPEEVEEKQDAATHKALRKILLPKGSKEPLVPEIILNGDPRGYCLKIRESDMKSGNYDLPTDWGGYGLIAPEFTGD